MTVRDEELSGRVRIAEEIAWHSRSPAPACVAPKLFVPKMVASYFHL
jgi:hypothetical protein